MKDSALCTSYKAVLDAIPEAVLRREEKEWIKGMVECIYLGSNDVLDDLRVRQIELQEDFTQILYVVYTRVHTIETSYIPVRKAAEAELAGLGKKLTVDQRESY